MADFFEHFAPEIGIGTTLVRLLVAATLGLVLGIDREYRSRPAGLRTHILVSVAAATFAMVAFELAERAKSEGFTSLDPTRVTEAVTAGIAFIAAGTIIRGRTGVHGLTTGAGLWLVGAIGLAAGIGAYGIAVLATVLGFAVLSALRAVEKYLPKKDPEDGGSKLRE